MKKNLLFLSMASLLFACSSEDINSELANNDAKVKRVTLSVEKFVNEDMPKTRVALSPNSENTLDFKWSTGDVIGIFPVAPTVGCQVNQILDKVGTNVEEGASFDGGAWQLKPGNTYTAYYPFQPSMLVSDSYDAIPVNMTGQIQKGDKSTSHLGAYDFMRTNPTQCEQNKDNVNLQFHHVGAIAWFQLTLPVAASWEKIEVTASTPVFTTKAKMNASTGSITTVETSNTISLNLENVTTTADDKKRTFYMSVLPTTETGAVTIKATTSTGETYSGTGTNKTFNAGKIRYWVTTLQ